MTSDDVGWRGMRGGAPPLDDFDVGGSPRPTLPLMAVRASMCGGDGIAWIDVRH